MNSRLFSFSAGPWRLGLEILVLAAGIWILSRTLIYLVPGDPITYLAHEALVDLSPDEFRSRMDLHQSLFSRLFAFPTNHSLITGRPVLPTVLQALSQTLILAFLTLVQWCSMTFLGLWLSHQSASIRKWLLRGSIALASVPLFVLSPLLLLFFAVEIPLFPVSHNPILPSFALALFLAGYWFRIISSAIDHYEVRSAKVGAEARGIKTFSVFTRYLFVPSLGTYFGYFGYQVSVLLNGSVLAEVIFQWNGIGSLLAESITNRDYPVLEVALFFVTTIGLISLKIGTALQRHWEKRLQ